MGLLGIFTAELGEHLPQMAVILVNLAIFLGLIVLLGYAKKKYKNDSKP